MCVKWEGGGRGGGGGFVASDRDVHGVGGSDRWIRTRMWRVKECVYVT